MRRGLNLVAVIVVLALVAVVVVIFFQSSVGPGGLKVSEYVSTFERADLSNPSGATAQPRTAIVDADYRRLDTMHFWLPTHLRAQRHEDVGSFVVVMRTSTGIPPGGGLTVAIAQPGHYSVSAHIFDAQGNLLQSHSIRRETAMTGAGAEGEARQQADQEMFEWIRSKLEG